MNRELAVVVAATGWDGIWMSERHVAMNLARTVDVLWVDPPVSRMTGLRNPAARAALRLPPLSEVHDGITRVAPVTVPGLTRPGLRTVVQRQVRSAIANAAATLGRRPSAMLVTGLGDQLGALPGVRSVFYGTDDFVAGADLMGVDRTWIERSLRHQLRSADAVVAVSDVLRDQWVAQRPDITVIPNGCDVRHFAATDDADLPTDVRLPGPIAGFVGHLSERVDVSYLEAVADLGISLLLVGPRQPTFDIGAIDALLARPNVQWVGPKSFDELPSYLRIIDVGLTPYADSAFNRASVPLKTLEYLAAGRPAVVSDLPSTRELGADLVEVTSSAQEFASATQKALDTPRTAEDVRRRRAFAAEQSWERRTADLADVMGLKSVEDRRAG